MDRTSRTVEELKKIIKTSNTELEVKDLKDLELIVEGVQSGKMNMLDVILGETKYQFSPMVIEKLREVYNKATTSIANRPHR
jgi:SepF-like predicted cell division protein (DUF552 family)